MEGWSALSLSEQLMTQLCAVSFTLHCLQISVNSNLHPVLGVV